MNDTETKPRYIPEESGNPLPDLSKHGTHNETPIPLHRTRAEPSRAMTDSPQKYLLPGGAELRDIIKRRIEATSQSTKALCAALARAYQIRGGHYESVLNEIAGMINSGELVQRDDELRVAEPTAAEIPAEMWTMTHTERVRHVLGDEPQTREALARATGLNPRQVSKAAYLLIQQGLIEVVGDVPRTWRATTVTTELGDKSRTSVRQGPDTELGKYWADKAETAVLSEQQTRDVALERASSACPEGVLIEDVARLSGWKRDTVAALLETMLRDGELARMDDMRIGLPVESEQPPPYEIGDEDDGEITEPGIARPAGQYVPESVTVTFVRRDSGGYVQAEHHITIDEHGLCFDGTALSFDAVDAVMPTLRRVHRAVFGGGDD